MAAITVTDVTPITLTVDPTVIEGAVCATPDTDAGDDTAQALIDALKDSDDVRAYRLGDRLQDWLWERQEAREAREEQARVDGGDWSDNQRAFIEKAREMDLVPRMYSGRGMCGEECPAVSGDYLDPDDFSDAGIGVAVDALGMGVVIYARS